MVVIVGISLMANAIRQTFMYLYVIYTPEISLHVFCLFSNRIVCFVWLVCFLLLRFESSLYIVDTGPLLNLCFANIVS